MIRFLKGLFIISLVFIFVPTAYARNPETLGDLRSDYNALVQEQINNRNKTEAEKANIATNKANIAKAEEDIATAKREMNEAQEKIDESNKRIAELTKESEKVLLYLQQMQSENAYVEYVSGASTITDLITRIAAVEQVSNHINKTMKDLENEIKKNEELKIELEEKRKNLEAQKVKYEESIKASYSKLDEYDKFALDIDTQVAVAKKNLDGYVALCEKNLNDTSDSVYLADCSKVPYNGQWLKPLYYGVITSTVQYYRYLGSLSGTHNAIDIGGNPEGTPVYAAAAGVVAGKIYHYSCGGNMLYINVTVNGQKYTTYYYHLLDFNVDVGDVVTQDDIVGYVGGGYGTYWDNCSTGAHLHFGVANGWYNGYNISWSNVIIPPGFPNQYGWRFYSRTDMYIE